MTGIVEGNVVLVELFVSASVNAVFIIISQCEGLCDMYQRDSLLHTTLSHWLPNHFPSNHI